MGGTNDARWRGVAALGQVCAWCLVVIVSKEIPMEWIKPAALIGSVLYALIGVGIFGLCFWIVDKLTPYDLWGEIVERQNKALGLVVAAISLGICIIDAAAIH